MFSTATCVGKSNSSDKALFSFHGKAVNFHIVDRNIRSCKMQREIAAFPWQCYFIRVLPIVSSFRSGIVEVSVLVEYGAASLFHWCPKFRDHFAVCVSIRQ
jgi:hypothetical protein